MTDRELLEAAAKAAGYDVRWHEIFGCFVHVGPFNITNPPTMAGQRLVWVPLDDDGDALRLAVKLRMQIDILDRSIYAVAMGSVRLCELDRADSQAATRRAITRAAAEIGRAML